jgi:3-oxosteroid 1-dehydrogenase
MTQAMLGDQDVVVMGSGAAGLISACVAADLGLRVTVLEAEAKLGGTSALSGGQMWLPGSDAMARGGHHDDLEAARMYLKRIVVGATATEVLDAFLDEARDLATYVETELDIELMSVDRPDYHPDWPGAGVGRTLEPLPIRTKELASWRERTVVSSSRRRVTSTEAHEGIDGHVEAERERADTRTQGAGLIAGLVRAALRRGVVLITGAEVTSVTAGSEGWVVGCSDGREARAAAAVVLAAGGFAQSDAMRRDFLPLTELVPTAANGSRGDGIRIGVALGGRVRRMDEAWWTAAVLMCPASGSDTTPMPRNIVRELAYPGSMMVNREGLRFVDEASSYNDLGKALLRFDPVSHTFPNNPAWLVFDDRFRLHRPILGAGPGQDLPPEFVTANSLADLAERTGVLLTGLQRTVTAMNRYARSGIDPEFGRGSNPHDRYNGDSRHVPNPCLGTIAEAPFHALPIHLGLNGTKGGLATDAYAAVLDANDQPIPGLFAVGETASALMGPGYAGAGASLGPAMVAAYSIRHRLKALVADPPLPRSHAQQNPHWRKP